MPGPFTRIDLTPNDLDTLLAHARPALADDEYRTLQALVETFRYLTAVLDDHTTTIARLRQILLGAATEKTRQVLKQAGLDGGPRRADPHAGDAGSGPEIGRAHV